VHLGFLQRQEVPRATAEHSEGKTGLCHGPSESRRFGTQGHGKGSTSHTQRAEAVREGDNRIEVTVFNTLADYFNVGPLPKDYVYEGQTLSGLIGPVTLSFPAEVTMTARPVQDQ